MRTAPGGMLGVSPYCTLVSWSCNTMHSPGYRADEFRGQTRSQAIERARSPAVQDAQRVLAAQEECIVLVHCVSYYPTSRRSSTICSYAGGASLGSCVLETNLLWMGMIPGLGSMPVVLNHVDAAIRFLRLHTSQNAAAMSTIMGTTMPAAMAA